MKRNVHTMPRMLTIRHHTSPGTRDTTILRDQSCTSPTEQHECLNGEPNPRLTSLTGS